jgi:hypothetical protein
MSSSIQPAEPLPQEEKQAPSPIKSHTIYVKQENNWKYIFIKLIRKWEIKRLPDLVDVKIKINNIMVKPSSKTDTHFIFDFPKLREKWFNLIGNTPAECDLIALEDACMYNQLVAINHYKFLPKDLLQGTLFADGEFTIVYEPEWKNRTKPSANKLEVIETYCVSDIHKTTYNDY